MKHSLKVKEKEKKYDLTSFKYQPLYVIVNDSWSLLDGYLKQEGDMGWGARRCGNDKIDTRGLRS